MWEVIQADARALPVASRSVDLIVTSPPYWGLRSYRDAGEHFDGQVGSEASPLEYVDQLVSMIDDDWRRVLKPTGSLFLNLGDKWAGSGGAGYTSGLGAKPMRERGSPGVFPSGTEVARKKSLLNLPHRVAIALTDRGWIQRATIIWNKPNGLPEPVTDRVRNAHEYWFHFTLEGQYYAAVDRIREPHQSWESVNRRSNQHNKGDGKDGPYSGSMTTSSRSRLDYYSRLGRAPGSVWTIPTQPLSVPPEAKRELGLTDHFAAFPMEWPRRIIEGWSPEKVCTKCGEGLRPVSERVVEKWQTGHKDPGPKLTHGGGRSMTANRKGGPLPNTVTATIVGEACACESPGPTTPGVVLDPFGGTGTTAGVAHMLGRHGISVDLSADYCRLAQWRIGQSGHFAKWFTKYHPARLPL